WLVIRWLCSRPSFTEDRRRRKAHCRCWSWQTERRLSCPFHEGRAGQSRAIGRLAENARSQQSDARSFYCASPSERRRMGLRSHYASWVKGDRGSCRYGCSCRQTQLERVAYRHLCERSFVGGFRQRSKKQRHRHNKKGQPLVPAA